MNPHYYHLKKLSRKKGVPLFAYKIDARDFNEESSWNVLKSALNVESVNELMQTSYILINEDRMKLPQPKEDADPAISFKFLENPLKVDNLDDLYDLLDLHKNEPHKYVCMLKNSQSEPRDFTL